MLDWNAFSMYLNLPDLVRTSTLHYIAMQTLLAPLAHVQGTIWNIYYVLWIKLLKVKVLSLVSLPHP